jgi:deoxyhypusine synthase
MQQKNLPIICPGWEDSTMGNIFASYVIKGDLKVSTMKSGIEYMTFLADWYPLLTGWIFPNGGGIAEISNCVPMLYQDMEMPETPFGATKFQIQLPVTVRILELFRMKNYLG